MYLYLYTKELSGVIEIFYILIMVVFTQVKTFIKAAQSFKICALNYM